MPDFASLQAKVTARTNKNLEAMLALEQAVLGDSPKVSQNLSLGPGVTLDAAARASELGKEHAVAELALLAAEAGADARGAQLTAADPAYVAELWQGLKQRVGDGATDVVEQIERILSTESWRAYNRARLDVAAHLATLAPSTYTTQAPRSLLRFDPKDYFVAIVKRWNAVLDRRTCRICGPLDGELVLLGDFFDRDIPVHPRCRCSVTYWPIPVPNPLT